MISRLLALLLLFLRPAAEAPGGDPPPDDPALDAGDDDPVLDDDPPEGDPPADDPAARLAAELATEKTERAKDKERAERFEREAADLRVRHAKPPTNSEWDEEEAILKDPKSTEQQRWTVGANRQLRANTHLAQSSMAQAADVNDRTAFSSVCIADSLAKKYEKRVEDELVRIRSQGQNASREAIYTFLLGKDMRDGKYRKKSAATTTADTKTAPRGKTPGVRSDVQGRGASLTEREKRIQRLENVQI